MGNFADISALCIVAIEFICVVFVNVALFIPSVKSYYPIRFQNKKVIRIMSIVGMIHTICAFISNEHYAVIEPLQSKWVCMGVEVWLQYFVGLNLWVMCLMKIMTDFGTFFKSDMFTIKFCKPSSPAKIHMIEIYQMGYQSQSDGSNKKPNGYSFAWIFFVIPTITFVPLLLYTIQYIDQEQICRSWDVVKIYIAIWCFLITMCIVYINIKLKGIKYIKEDMKSYKPIGSILSLGFDVIIINAIIHISGLWGISYLRFLATSSISVLHIVTLYVLIANHIKKALDGDTKHASDYVKTYQWSHRVPMHDPSRSSEIESFKSFCRIEAHKTLPRKWYHVATDHVIDCYDTIDEFLKGEAKRVLENGGRFMNPNYIDPEWKAIVDRFFTPGSSKYVAIYLTLHIERICPNLEDIPFAFINPTKFFTRNPEFMAKNNTNYILSFLDYTYGTDYDAYKCLTEPTVEENAIIRKNERCDYDFSEWYINEPENKV